ncbi:MAG: flagellar basal body L-ring protein FlgH [Methylomonas sp.]|nr:flagellar basal body L-ring protein FlgH [Methylomonas sp.]PPD19981.1 MAG: flagellar basal body L-ring protein FlgH [Methylomonas sp.]PPD26517.1 MAG: flagellar basal body L-ring protein FlgH [Methylomonas sp.]PPD36945.1 MAG: flagellar basal body L-ring protein FlgH [Methylomonas sp.]PPD38284.1 MAG: flagellar basal body L-ring protein FlgH [Methylomonas sp.]
MRNLMLLTLFTTALAGCDTLPKRDPDFSAVQPADLRPPPQNNGAIYQADFDMRLFEDYSARRVGDILTIQLRESTSARKQADSSETKEANVSVTAPTLFGMAAKTVLGRSLETEVNANRSFQGQGDTQQSNRLTGNISVTVTEVLPSGNLKVRGEKRVTLSDGDEYIRVSGIVRPIDIDASNSLPSSKLADATIMYTGEGAMADSAKVGWIGRVLLSPWFPF